MGASVVPARLSCAFKRHMSDIKEILIVREPISRAISVYYFWGELFKVASANKAIRSNRKKLKRELNRDRTRDIQIASNSADNTDTRDHRFLIHNPTEEALEGMKSDAIPRDTPWAKLGSSGIIPNSTGIKGGKFFYHGVETTSPPEDIALRYARRMPYRAGMPGPSYTWSLFSNNALDALDVIKHQQERLMVLVTERLDESLVVMMHFFNRRVETGKPVQHSTYWSLADIIYVTRRKSLSKHPKASDWPASAIDIVNKTFHENGEVAIYKASSKVLNERITMLSQDGIDVAAEVELFKQLRQRVSEVSVLVVL